MRTQRILGLLIAMVLLSTPRGWCDDVSFKSDKEFGEWMTYYYQNPDPTRIPGALKYFSDSALFKTGAGIPTIAFFSALFRKDDNLMHKTFDEVSASGSENAKLLLVNALSLTQNAESKDLLKKAKSEWSSSRLKDTIEGRISGEQIDLYTTEISNPGVLDMLWASFFATGDVLPIQRIISVLHLRKDGHGEEIIVGGAAEWSLRSNVTQHPKVLWICKQELTKSEGLTKTLLEDVLKPTPK